MATGSSLARGEDLVLTFCHEKIATVTEGQNINTTTLCTHCIHELYHAKPRNFDIYGGSCRYNNDDPHRKGRGLDDR